MDKKELRRTIRERKRAMTEEEIVSRSEKLGHLFAQSEAYKAAKTIYGYLPYNQEVRTVPMLEQALKDGKRVAVPKVYGEEMKFLYLDDLTKVEKGYAGIPEPIADGPVADDETALVLMPGLAFDPQGHRIGYGGGFYDKFLAAEPNHPTLALCYEFQMLPKLDTEEHDIPVDTILWA
ncbi:MAG: 5-formyltetrahydrofolate cyclo-ligase [Candidatus Faecousia sp.]|nr:5-formyltetrahydrofolate cyclo-ligase [Clostridiales bacterium]MDD5883178.1 5-formyltetrahydrofolate cyclo-ligase [Bacillota bacterium]MDY4599448.1 5-formyltetrahydrofolate cyclo-ligase [Candidatus Faecousia sp.]